MAVFVQILTALLAVVSVCLTYRASKLAHELDRARATVERYREHEKGTTTFDYEYIDAVLLGPRDSGKTSLAQLWRAPWTNIHDIASTGGWTTYEFTLHEFARVKRYDEFFDVQRTFAPVLRLRVHDNPGEERERFAALKSINKLRNRVVLVLVFRTAFVNDAFSEVSSNASYFSRAFLQEVEKEIVAKGRKIARVIVVFGKSDTVPATTGRKELTDELKKGERRRREPDRGGVWWRNGIPLCKRTYECKRDIAAWFNRARCYSRQRRG
jgi:hypothetical protein